MHIPANLSSLTWPMTTYDSQLCLLFIIYLYMPSAVLLHLCVDPFQPFIPSHTYARTHQLTLLCLIWFCYQNSPFLLLINWRIFWHFFLPLSSFISHSSFINRREKSWPFSTELIITFTKNSFYAFAEQFSIGLNFMAHQFIFFSPYEEKSDCSKSIFGPNGRTCLVFTYVSFAFSLAPIDYSQNSNMGEIWSAINVS